MLPRRYRGGTFPSRLDRTEPQRTLSCSRVALELLYNCSSASPQKGHMIAHSDSDSAAQASIQSTRFTLAIHDGGQADGLAYRFALAALNSGHLIEQVFFYHDAIHSAERNQTPNPEDLATPNDWGALASRGNFPLHVCVAAAQRRGITEEQQAEPSMSPLKPGFELVGLGQYVAGMIDADRVVTFSNR